MTNLHYIADEKLGGVEREYSEVACESRVEDYIVVKDTEFGLGYYDVGDIFSVIKTDEKGVSGFNEKTGTFYLFHSEYATLKPTGNVLIDGAAYRLVDRKAKVGDKVLIIVFDHEMVGEVRNVTALDAKYVDDFYLDKPIDDEDYLDTAMDEYWVLVPTEIVTGTYDSSKAVIAGNPPADELTLTEADVRNNPRQVIDLIANMAGRLSAVEKELTEYQALGLRDHLRQGNTEISNRIDRLASANEQAIRMVACNVETWAQEIETIKARMGDAGRALTAEERREL